MHSTTGLRAAELGSALALCLLLLAGCSDTPPHARDAAAEGRALDAARPDAARPDAALDAGAPRERGADRAADGLAEGGAAPDAAVDAAAPADAAVDAAVPADAFIAPAITVERWRHGAAAALSLTFDDATLDHFDLGLALWNSFGFRVTLAVDCLHANEVSGVWAGVQQAFDQGHELANHTLNHPLMPKLTLAQAQYEIDACTAQLKAYVTGLDRVVSYVHPFSETNATVGSLVAQRFIVARGGDPGGVLAFAEPVGRAWLDVPAFVPIVEVPLATWNEAVTQTVAIGGWLVEQCHGIDGPGAREVGWQPRTLAEYTAHYQHVQSFGAQIWVAPLGEVARYAQSRARARIAVCPAGQDVLQVDLTDGLDRAIYDVPLTLVTTVPAGWNAIGARQGSKILATTPLPDGRVRFEARPGCSPIELRPAGS